MYKLSFFVSQLLLWPKENAALTFFRSHFFYIYSLPLATLYFVGVILNQTTGSNYWSTGGNIRARCGGTNHFRRGSLARDSQRDARASTIRQNRGELAGVDANHTPNKCRSMFPLAGKEEGAGGGRKRVYTV